MSQAGAHGDRSIDRLSQIRTNWSQLFLATGPTGESASEAQKELLLNYSGAVFRYLSAAVRNDHTASDLAQEFAVRFLRGDFRSVTPEKGRFRDFLKRTLSNLVNDHFRKQSSELNRMDRVAQTLRDSDPDNNGTSFEENWVNEVLRRTWDQLAADQVSQKTQYYTVLRARAESPELNSRELCDVLAAGLPDHTLNEAWVRQNLSRARRQFAALLRQEVSRTLRDTSPESVEEELAALGLLKYCK